MLNVLLKFYVNHLQNAAKSCEFWSRTHIEDMWNGCRTFSNRWSRHNLHLSSLLVALKITRFNTTNLVASYEDMGKITARDLFDRHRVYRTFLRLCTSSVQHHLTLLRVLVTCSGHTLKYKFPQHHFAFVIPVNLLLCQCIIPSTF